MKRREPGAAARWWQVRLFHGMVQDVRRRAPWYASDWLDAWNYRVVPATVYMYFANILPALAFSLDMFSKTDMQYGVNEVLLASVLGAVVFSVAACQPLVIVGVTGPITVFNYTVYDLVKQRVADVPNFDYLGFMCWIGMYVSA
jgi:boron transporter